MAIPVKLPVFEGPLDLLMHLIEKNKIDIYDIPIVEITDQYLEYVHAMDHEDMDVTSEFLVMAATLLDIKSRMLLPREKDAETGEEETDPREELVQRLLEYKMYKYLSEELAVCREQAGVRYFRAQNLPREVRSYQPPIDYGDLLKGTDLQSLQKVFKEVLRRKKSRQDPIRSGFGKIKREEVSIDTKALYIRAYLQTHPHTDFRALLESRESREEVIVTFLILLELMKVQKVHIVQDSIGGKILIEAGKDIGDPVPDQAEAAPDPELEEPAPAQVDTSPDPELEDPAPAQVDTSPDPELEEPAPAQVDDAPGPQPEAVPAEPALENETSEDSYSRDPIYDNTDDTGRMELETDREDQTEEEDSALSLIERPFYEGPLFEEAGLEDLLMEEALAEEDLPPLDFPDAELHAPGLPEDPDPEITESPVPAEEAPAPEPAPEEAPVRPAAGILPLAVSRRMELVSALPPRQIFSASAPLADQTSRETEFLTADASPVFTEDLPEDPARDPVPDPADTVQAVFPEEAAPDSTDETPAEQAADIAAEALAEPVGNAAEEAPAEQAADTAAKAPAEPVGNTAEEAPAGQAADTATEAPAEPVGNAAEEAPAEQAADTTEETPAGQAADTAAETPAGQAGPAAQEHFSAHLWHGSRPACSSSFPASFRGFSGVRGTQHFLPGISSVRRADPGWESTRLCRLWARRSPRTDKDSAQE